MNATLRCMTAASGGMIETNYLSIMSIAFAVDKKGSVFLHIGDSITTDKPKDMKGGMESTAYPNCGEAHFGIQDLWLSMLIRDMINAHIIEIEF
ncbi:MAG: hypothetical protein P1P85_03010 [Patescibacteria group bacterium]|nr:hypothetical protein [Patescibacteria group bacterium]